VEVVIPDTAIDLFGDRQVSESAGMVILVAKKKSLSIKVSLERKL
jgi:hypothetical protein